MADGPQRRTGSGGPIIIDGPKPPGRRFGAAIREWRGAACMLMNCESEPYSPDQRESNPESWGFGGIRL